MIYVDTQRPFWAGLPTSLRFGGSSLLFGLLAIGFSRLLSGESVQWIAGLTWLLALYKLGYEAYQVWGPHSQVAKMTPAKKSAALMRGSGAGYPAPYASPVRLASCSYWPLSFSALSGCWGWGH